MSGGTHIGTSSTVRILDDQECRDRLAAATVARVGYVMPSGMQITPLNYRSTGTSLMLSTTPRSALSQLAEMGASVAVEVDYHDSSMDLAWSVLMQGTLSTLDRQGRARLDALPRPVESWLGEQASEHLEFTPRSYSGRVLQRLPL